jgi:hypothetical protein
MRLAVGRGSEGLGAAPLEVVEAVLDHSTLPLLVSIPLLLGCKGTDVLGRPTTVRRQGAPPAASCPDAHHDGHHLDGLDGGGESISRRRRRRSSRPEGSGHLLGHPLP